MEFFENGTDRGFHLQLAYDMLMTIPPTSVESERTFSIAGILCSKIRSSLSDDTLDQLIFLRNFFKKQVQIHFFSYCKNLFFMLCFNIFFYLQVMLQCTYVHFYVFFQLFKLNEESMFQFLGFVLMLFFEIKE